MSGGEGGASGRPAIEAGKGRQEHAADVVHELIVGALVAALGLIRSECQHPEVGNDCRPQLVTTSASRRPTSKARDVAGVRRSPPPFVHSLSMRWRSG